MVKNFRETMLFPFYPIMMGMGKEVLFLPFSPTQVYSVP